MKASKINNLLFFIMLISSFSCTYNDLEFENNESINKTSSVGNGDNDNSIYLEATITDYVVNIEFDRNFVNLEDLDRISHEIIYGTPSLSGIFYPGVILNLVPSNTNSTNPYIKSWIVTVRFSPNITPTGGISDNGVGDPRMITYSTVPIE